MAVPIEAEVRLSPALSRCHQLCFVGLSGVLSLIGGP
jgi:hypothetical protein